MIGVLYRRRQIAERGSSLSVKYKKQYMEKIDNIIILGGGCYGSLFSKRLSSARKKKTISYDHQLIVDKNEQCKLKQENKEEDLIFYQEDFISFFVNIYKKIKKRKDFLVLPCNTPHFIFLLFKEMLKKENKFLIKKGKLNEDFHLPFEKDIGDTKYLSFAKWQCPILCIEPDICPAIHQKRSWKLKEVLTSCFNNINDLSKDNVYIFEIDFYINGVGIININRIIESFEKFRNSIKEDFQKYIIATISNCHGAISVLEVKNSYR